MVGFSCAARSCARDGLAMGLVACTEVSAVCMSFFLPGEQFNSAYKKRCLDRFCEIQGDTISGVRLGVNTLQVVFW